MRHGTPVPEYGGSRTFGSIETYYATETGRPVLLAALNGGGYQIGLFREEDTGLSLLFDSDDPAVGIPDATLDPAISGLHESPVTGTTVLSAYWYGPGGAESGHGLWRIHEEGNWELLMSSAQSFSLSPADLRTIASLNAHVFTSEGVLPIDVQFTDGSSAIVSWTDLPSRLPGDANGDSIVDEADHALWRRAFGQPVLGGYGADFNGDRMVNQADYVLWRKNFGRATDAIAQTAAPEPFTAVLALLLLASLIFMRPLMPQSIP